MIREDDETVASQDEGNEHRPSNQIAIFSEERDFQRADEDEEECYLSRFWLLAVVAVCLMVLIIVIMIVTFSLQG